jgi:acetyl esterase/lipase
MVGQRDHLVEDREPADLEATPPQSLLPDVSPASRPRRLLVAGMSLVLLAGCTQLPTPTPAQQPVPAPAVAARTIAPSATATAAPTPTATPRATASPGLARLPRPSMSPTTQVTTSMRVPYTPAIACAEPAGTTCSLAMDIVRPSDAGPWPVFVLLQGGPSSPGQSDYLLPVATAIAQRGAVVMVADWRQAAAFAGGYPASFQDAACAVGVARAVAPRYGGDPGDVTVVGHSLGGWAAAVISLAQAPMSPAPGTCDPTAGSLRPDALVDLDGATDEPATMEDGAAYVAAFFGGTRAQQPAAYAAADVLDILASHPAGDDPIPILLVHGQADTTVSPSVSTDLHAALLAAGYANQLLLIPGDHNAALVSPAVVTAITSLNH